MATSDTTQTCPDGHQCENGSLCVETKQEGRYACDCDESNLNGATVFSGLYCSHEATVYCTMDGPGAVSSISFCTNNGTCKGTVGKNGKHLGCDCPSGYTGMVCACALIEAFFDRMGRLGFNVRWFLNHHTDHYSSTLNSCALFLALSIHRRVRARWISFWWVVVISFSISYRCYQLSRAWRRWHWTWHYGRDSHCCILHGSFGRRVCCLSSAPS